MLLSVNDCTIFLYSGFVCCNIFQKFFSLLSFLATTGASFKSSSCISGLAGELALFLVPEAYLCVSSAIFFDISTALETCKIARVTWGQSLYRTPLWPFVNFSAIFENTSISSTDSRTTFSRATTLFCSSM